MNAGIKLIDSHALEQWAVWFEKEFAPSDLDEDGVLAFMHYFADLGILESTADDNKWQLSGIDVNSAPEKIRDKVANQLEEVSRATAGFAVNFFLGRQADIPPVNKETSGREASPKINPGASNLEKASDLSNLQIVKKVGRQLQPFLELEKATVARLTGPHTQVKEARVIFNFILRHTKTKAEPKKWEQLSRKRHK